MKTISLLLAALLLHPFASSAIAAEEVPRSTSVCPDQDLSAVVPADAAGTTFTGTYLGDSLSDDSLYVSWSVETVHAGPELPADLILTAPPCLWTNLTPGSRYLFSTASGVVVDPGAGPTSAAPTVLDSLAWTIGDDGSVAVAPFDDYAPSYYGDAVLGITTLDEALDALSAGDSVAPGPAQAPAFGCASPRAAIELAEAEGTAFIGTFVGSGKLPSGPILVRDSRTHWVIESVITGGPLPEVLTQRSPGCGPIELKPGARYVFSTASPLAPANWDSMAWRILDDGSARLTPLGDVEKKNHSAEVRGLKTLDDVARALGGSPEDLDTPTRSGDRTPG